MKTKVEKHFLNTLTELAKKYAHERAIQFNKNYYKKVFNSSYDVYMTIGLFLYIRIGTATIDVKDFNYNRIPSTFLKKFSCKLYNKIIQDLEKNRIIRRNNHYNHISVRNGKQQQIFCKSFLFSHSFQSKVKRDAEKFKLQFELIELPKKLSKIFENQKNEIEKIQDNGKLNRNLIEQIQRTETDTHNSFRIKNCKSNYYSEIDFDLTDLNDFCKTDEFKRFLLLKILNKLKNSAIKTNNRWYHAFHRLSKDCREKVLRFENEKLKEIFDVTGSDLHMLAKHLENVKEIPTNELLKFQKDVISDFRKIFGIRKNDGKCTARVKRAFKVYLNSKNNFYFNIRRNSICQKIDLYMEENYPNIRKYIINKDKIWEDVMKYEFNILSEKMYFELFKRGVISFTCHDAIYVKESVNIPDIQSIFYNCLGLSIYYQDILENI